MSQEYVALFLQDPDVREPDEILDGQAGDDATAPLRDLPSSDELNKDPAIGDVVAATRALLQPMSSRR
jgi:hypothetical protein